MSLTRCQWNSWALSSSLRKKGIYLVGVFKHGIRFTDTCVYCSGFNRLKLSCTIYSYYASRLPLLLLPFHRLINWQWIDEVKGFVVFWNNQRAVKRLARGGPTCKAKSITPRGKKNFMSWTNSTPPKSYWIPQVNTIK